MAASSPLERDPATLAREFRDFLNLAVAGAVYQLCVNHGDEAMSWLSHAASSAGGFVSSPWDSSVFGASGFFSSGPSSLT